MRTIHFFKYHGCGNDFIILDSVRNPVEKLTTESIKWLCDRHFGIGADGMMVFSPGSPGFDFSMRYFNSDGNESTMCGNGGRCISLFALRHFPEKNHLNFMAADGPHESQFLDNGDIQLRMKDVDKIQALEGGFLVDTGSPHFVRPITEENPPDVLVEGRHLRHDPRFAPGGVNVNFFFPRGNQLVLRTYERGVEDETLACGTGSVATALSWAFMQSFPIGMHRVDVQTLGGLLHIGFFFQPETKTDPRFSQVSLTGPARFVFEGKVELPSN